MQLSFRHSGIAVALVAAMSLTACTNPNDPGQRTVGGGLMGAGVGAALGALTGGGNGAAIGALAGGALGAGTGYITTPQSQGPSYYRQSPSYR